MNTTPTTTDETRSTAERLEEEAALAGLVAAGAIRAVDVAAIVLVGLLVVPPLAILVFLVVAPLLAVALVLGLLAAILSTPYVVVQHFRGHHGGHASVLAHRLRVAARALFDLAPHRIHAAARDHARHHS